MDKMFDLTIAHLADGNVRIKQQSGSGESYTIDLHPIQIRLLAERAGLLRHEPDARRVPDLERRLAVLTDKIQDFACDGSIRSEIIERCSYGLSIIARLDGLVDLALEFDGGRLTPEEPSCRDQAEAPVSDAATSKPPLPLPVTPVRVADGAQFGLEGM